MTKTPDLLVFRRDRAPLQLTARYRRSAAYRQFRAQLAQLETFADLVALLDQLAKNPSAEARAAAVLEFAPASPVARRFLNSIGLALGRPKADPMHILAERGMHALAGLQRGPAGRPGRPRGMGVSASQVAAVVAARRRWTAALLPLWAEAAGDRGKLLVALQAACRGVEARVLEGVVRRPALRPVDLANQLTAWETAVPVRGVRAVMRATRAARSDDRQFA